jgi:SAM-dependent MidA family methyltransferase
VTTPLARILAQRIAREGPLPIDTWMAACLHHPEHGYYTKHVPIGAAGDFTTAPEVSQIFGELIGAWIAQFWLDLGKPRPVRLVELGPGRGTLMADALRALARPAPEFLAALDLHLVEVNRDLRALQRERLGQRATWHDSFATIPGGPLIVVANEFFDALPVRQIECRGAVWQERCVVLVDERFVVVAGPRLAEPRAPAPDGTIIEIGEAACSLIRDIAARIASDGGGALVIDYGAAVSGVGDTLQAVSRHTRADPLADLGAVDLTAHVDFAALAQAAQSAGARAWGPVPQGRFLHRLGLAARAASLMRDAMPETRAAIARDCARLVDDDAMGILFKALAITGASRATPPAGFDP